MQKIPMTSRGLELLEQELKTLKTVERPAVIEAIAKARSFGDLSENAEYDAAKDKQGMIEGRIKELELKISLSEVINPTKISCDNIKFGATVTILDLDNEKQNKYQIVGVDEANIQRGLLSINSPLAKSLIGKYMNDIIDVSAPGGEKNYEILKIDYC